MKIKVVSLLLAMLLLPGCASIVSKSEYAVKVTSDPEGAEYRIYNRKGLEVMKGITPAQVTLRSGSGFFLAEKYTIEMKKTGYRDASGAFSSDIDPWYFGNIVFGGILGALLIDPGTGAMFMLQETMLVPLYPIPLDELEQVSSMSSEQAL